MSDAVVLLYAPPWSGPTRFSKHHLARYLAERGRRVLYIEAPLTPLGARRGRAFVRDLQQTFRPPRLVSERLWARRHFLPLPYHAALRLTNARAANRLGQALLAPVVRRDLRRLGFERPLLIAGLPHAADIVARLPHRGLVYHCADDYSAVHGFPSTLGEAEADLCRRADLVVTTSETLRANRVAYNPHTYWIPNGVQLDVFARPVEPAPELHAIPRPIVGFVGGLSEWVDLGLVGDLARQRPDWSFVLVGPASIDLAPVATLPNVHLLGPRAYDRVPAYLAAMDVAIIPFKNSLVSYHADPIKAYEYLATGVPVTATDLPALRRLGGVVRLAGSPATFLAELDLAIRQGRDHGRAERQAEAARHSWATRFACFERLVAERLACAS